MGLLLRSELDEEPSPSIRSPWLSEIIFDPQDGRITKLTLYDETLARGLLVVDLKAVKSARNDPLMEETLKQAAAKLRRPRWEIGEVVSAVREGPLYKITTNQDGKKHVYALAEMNADETREFLVWTRLLAAVAMQCPMEKKPYRPNIPDKLNPLN